MRMLQYVVKAEPFIHTEYKDDIMQNIQFSSIFLVRRDADVSRECLRVLWEQWFQTEACAGVLQLSAGVIRRPAEACLL